LLKRVDEKCVTERAYDNPKFVEDVVRDVAVALNNDPRVVAYTVEAENVESVHNHSALARIVGPSVSAGAAHEQGGAEDRRLPLPVQKPFITTY
jgi:GTP cyclohydrolase FolE2